MLFGSYDAQCIADVPHSNAYRHHLYELDEAGHMVWPSVNGPVPPSWPKSPPGTAGFYTIYPNPVELLAGELDGAIQAMIRNAPPGSMLTAYAEADADAAKGGQFALLGLTADIMQQVHARLFALCQGSNVRYGAVNCGYGSASNAFVTPGLDFYGLDIYEPCRPGIMSALEDFAQNMNSVQPGATLAIAECNSNVQARRPYWFASIFGFMKRYEKHDGPVAAFMTYWHAGGPLSGPWLPGDAAVIATLSACAWAAP